MGQFTFRKEERLASEKNIQHLFGRGASFHIYPFKIIYLVADDQQWPFHQTLISVSAKRFGRAVDRNLIKRRMREVFRLSKSRLNQSPKLWIGLVYTAKGIESFALMSSAMEKIIPKINEKMAPGP
jgi:ribonuclease P protein component